MIAGKTWWVLQTFKTDSKCQNRMSIEGVCFDAGTSLLRLSSPLLSSPLLSLLSSLLCSLTLLSFRLCPSGTSENATCIFLWRGLGTCSLHVHKSRPQCRIATVQTTLPANRQFWRFLVLHYFDCLFIFKDLSSLCPLDMFFLVLCFFVSFKRFSICFFFLSFLLPFGYGRGHAWKVTV